MKIEHPVTKKILEVPEPTDDLPRGTSLYPNGLKKLDLVPDDVLRADDLQPGSNAVEWSSYLENVYDFVAGQEQFAATIASRKASGSTIDDMTSSFQKTAKNAAAEARMGAVAALLEGTGIVVKPANSWAGGVPLHPVEFPGQTGRHVSIVVDEKAPPATVALRARLIAGAWPEPCEQFRSGLSEHQREAFAFVLQDAGVDEMNLAATAQGLTNIRQSVVAIEGNTQRLRLTLAGPMMNSPKGALTIEVNADGHLAIGWEPALRYYSSAGEPVRFVLDPARVVGKDTSMLSIRVEGDGF